VIEARLPIPAAFAIYPGPLFEAALYGLLAAAIFTLWPIARTEDIRAATLFRDALAAGSALPAPRYIIATALLLALLIGAAIAFSGTWELTLFTAGGIAGALLLLTLAAALARVTARKVQPATRGRPALRLALGAIGARGGETTSVVLSLGLGLAVLAAVGQIDGNLRRAIQSDLPDIAPSYFFVDIQPDQIAGFRDRLATDPAVSRVDSAPMLRGIITQINGIAANDFAQGHWVVRGDRGITYSDTLPPGTTLTAATGGPPITQVPRSSASPPTRAPRSAFPLATRSPSTSSAATSPPPSPVSAR
jgi:putative ABC transport system permease protein